MIRFSRPRLVILLLAVAVLIFRTEVLVAAIPAPMRPANTTPIEKMRTGTIAPEKDKVDEMAEWLAFRLVQPPFNGHEQTTKVYSDSENIETLIDEVERWCRRRYERQPPNEGEIRYAKEFGQAMRDRIMLVIDDPATQRLEKVNASRMLAIIGKLQYEGIADTYLKMIRDDKYPPELKRYAFEGLRNLLSIPAKLNENQFDPTKHFITNNLKLAEISTELEKFVTKKLDPSLTTDQIRVEQFIRREAVRALAADEV